MAAPQFWSSGRTAIQTDRVTPSTFATLGWLDSDELIDIQIGIINRPLKSSRGGDTILDAIYAGSNGFISIILPEWSEVEWAQIAEPPGGTNQGDLGTPGALWVDGSFAFQMRIMPVDSSLANQATVKRPSYTFGRCIVDGEQDGLRLFNVGVAETRIAINLIALPDGSNDIYTRATS